MKISVITPCFNAAKHVGAGIRSLQAQWFSDWEHVVVDDGSVDESASIVRGLSRDDPRIRLVEQANAGCAAARNAGFRAARESSQYVMFLDADDCLVPAALGTLCEYLDRNSSVGMVHCRPNCIDEGGALLLGNEADPPWPARYIPTRWGVRALKDDEARTPFNSIFAPAGIIPSLCLFRRDVYEQTRGWDEEMGIDMRTLSFIFQIALLSQVHYLPQKLVLYRRHPGPVDAAGCRDLSAAQERSAFTIIWIVF